MKKEKMKKNGEKTPDQELFISRELSWIDFNSRVLDEALTPANPLLERLKFIAIFSSNLDEFFMVRIAGLRQLVKMDQDRPDPAGNRPSEQLAAARRKLERLLKQSTGKLKEDSTGAKKVYNTYEVIYMQEADRQRIARDIHDTVVQGLTALIHKNEFVGKIFETDKQRAQLELKKNNNVIRDSINELRNIIFDLRPMSLDDLGFEKTFYTAIEKIKGTTQMVVKADYLCDTDSMNPIIGITVIRIIQELCSNSIKYSKGTKIQVTIKQDKQNELLILYSDNGEGYDLNKPTDCTKNNTGFGLNMMRERIALLQGKMEVCYKDGELSYTIRIPLDTQKI